MAAPSGGGYYESDEEEGYPASSSYKPVTTGGGLEDKQRRKKETKEQRKAREKEEAVFHAAEKLKIDPMLMGRVPRKNIKWTEVRVFFEAYVGYNSSRKDAVTLALPPHVLALLKDPSYAVSKVTLEDASAKSLLFPVGLTIADRDGRDTTTNNIAGHTHTSDGTVLHVFYPETAAGSHNKRRLYHSGTHVMLPPLSDAADGKKRKKGKKSSFSDFEKNESGDALIPFDHPFIELINGVHIQTGQPPLEVTSDGFFPIEMRSLKGIKVLHRLSQEQYINITPRTFEIKLFRVDGHDVFRKLDLSEKASAKEQVKQHPVHFTLCFKLCSTVTIEKEREDLYYDHSAAN